MLRSFSASKARLQKPVVDMVQLHWPPVLGWQEREYLAAFEQIIKTNQVTQIGLSNFGPIGLERVVKQLRERDVPVYSNQV